MRCRFDYEFCFCLETQRCKVYRLQYFSIDQAIARLAVGNFFRCPSANQKSRYGVGKNAMERHPFLVLKPAPDDDVELAR